MMRGLKRSARPSGQPQPAKLLQRLRTLPQVTANPVAEQELVQTDVGERLSEKLAVTEPLGELHCSMSVRACFRFVTDDVARESQPELDLDAELGFFTDFGQRQLECVLRLHPAVLVIPDFAEPVEQPRPLGTVRRQRQERLQQLAGPRGVAGSQVVIGGFHAAASFLRTTVLRCQGSGALQQIGSGGLGAPGVRPSCGAV